MEFQRIDFEELAAITSPEFANYVKSSLEIAERYGYAFSVDNGFRFVTLTVSEIGTIKYFQFSKGDGTWSLSMIPQHIIDVAGILIKERMKL